MLSLNQVIPIPLKDQIEASDIWKTSFTLESSKRYFIEAPSGKGKTTLQHFLYGLRTDYEGTISLRGGDIKDFDLEDWSSVRQQQLSVVFQDLRLFLELTALENIQLKNKLTNHKSVAAIEEMTHQLGVVDLLHKPCGQLSYGQRQRIAIIRALCQPFELLLMDEPFAHLDSANIAKCCQLIMQETAANKAGYAIASLEERYDLEYDISVCI